MRPAFPRNDGDIIANPPSPQKALVSDHNRDKDSLSMSPFWRFCQVVLKIGEFPQFLFATSVRKAGTSNWRRAARISKKAWRYHSQSAIAPDGPLRGPIIAAIGRLFMTPLWRFPHVVLKWAKSTSRYSRLAFAKMVRRNGDGGPIRRKLWRNHIQSSVAPDDPRCGP